MFKAAIGRFYNVDSPIHKLDPRMKINILILLIVTAFITSKMIGLCLLLLFLMIVVMIARIPILVLLKTIAPFTILFLIPLVFDLFLVNTGNVLISIGNLQITNEGVFSAIYLTLRLVLLFLAAATLTLVTSPISLSDAVESMLSPLKRFGFPAHEISMILSIAMSFIPTFSDEMQDIKNAQASRGSSIDSGNFIVRMKAFLPLLIPMFVGAFRHAEELAMAMESRCYTGGENRTHYHVLKIAKSDWIAFSIGIIFLILIIALQFTPIL